MLHFLSGALFLSILALSIGVIVASVRAEMASIRRALGIAQPAPRIPPARQARARVVKRAEFRRAPALRACAA